MSEERENAGNAAHALKQELESIGVVLDGVDVPGIDPDNCPAGPTGYLVRLGTMGVEDVRAFTAVIRALRRQAAATATA